MYSPPEDSIIISFNQKLVRKIREKSLKNNRMEILVLIIIITEVIIAKIVNALWIGHGLKCSEG